MRRTVWTAPTVPINYIVYYKLQELFDLGHARNGKFKEFLKTEKEVDLLHHYVPYPPPTAGAFTRDI